MFGISRPMYPLFLVLAVALGASSSAQTQSSQRNPRAWMNQVRIGAYGLSSNNSARIVNQAGQSGVYGIEVDNDIEGRYESFLNPAEKLAAIRKLATLAHQHGNRAFVYIAGFECITANADATPHTLAKEHPDWLQRMRSGKPAVFSAGSAFWIAPGDEDVWVSPYATEWRKIYMQRVRQIAATGIDGIYLDIPYWMTHFTGWEDSWASFDPYTVATFKRQTGLDAMTDFKPGDFSDPGFRKWVDFRIQTITDFLAEVRKNATAVNPRIALIPEIYPGIEDSAVRVGADVYSIYPVVDAVAHEYEYGDDEDHTAASRGEFDWFMYQVGMLSFRAFAEGKPTWILNYSWDNNPRVLAPDAMKNLALSEVVADANVWDAPGHSMAGSNDLATRKEIFAWIAKYSRHLYSPRSAVASVGVYFSDATRNYYPDEFVSHYRGVLLLLLRNHIQFEIVTPRTLDGFKGGTLILPDVRVLSGDESRRLNAFAAQGGKVILTGYSDPALENAPHALHFAHAPELAYLELAAKDFNATPPPDVNELLQALAPPVDYTIQASPDLVVYVAKVDGVNHWYFANFSGFKKGAATTPTPLQNVIITAPSSAGTTLRLAPFLGRESTIAGQVSGSRVTFTIPLIERGAIAWTER